jgi:hypothetical protein
VRETEWASSIIIIIIIIIIFVVENFASGIKVQVAVMIVTGVMFDKTTVK